MLDRWSVIVYKPKLPQQAYSCTILTEDLSKGSKVQQFPCHEDSVAAHLPQILTSNKRSGVISLVKVLRMMVEDFMAEMRTAYEETTELGESEVMAKKVCSLGT